MKISLTKDMASIRSQARYRLDTWFQSKRGQSPNADVHAQKLIAALGHKAGVPSPLITSDADADTIISRASNQAAYLATQEADRQAVQAEIDRAQTVPEIVAILSERGIDATGF